MTHRWLCLLIGITVIVDSATVWTNNSKINYSEVLPYLCFNRVTIVFKRPHHRGVNGVIADHS